MNKSVLAPQSATELLLHWMISQNIPFHAISSPIFRKCWTKLNQLELVPTRKSLSGERLDALFDTVSKHIAEALAYCDHLSLTTDGWTGLHTSFWSITVSSISPDWRYLHYRLGCFPIVAESHNAHFLYTQIVRVMKELKLDPSKVSSVTTDEGGAAPMIAQHFEDANEIHCVAHLLNTTLRRAFEQITEALPWVSCALSVCRDLASKCNKSTLMREQLIANQLDSDEPVRTLKQSVSTRWNSILSNLRSVADCKNSIKAFLGARINEIPFATWTLRNEEYFFGLIEHLISLLTLFDAMTRDVCVENQPTAQLIVQRYLLLQRKLESFQMDLKTTDNRHSHEAIICADIIAKQLQHKFEPFEQAELMAFALDPQHRLLEAVTDFACRWNNVLTQGYDYLKVHLEPLVKCNTDVEIIETQNPPDIKDDSPWTFPELTKQKYARRHKSPLDIVNDELRQFIEMEIQEKCNLLEWWRRHSITFPHLSQLARRYLAIPASQASSERDFSRMRLLCTHLRNKLDPIRAWKISVIAPAIKKFHHPDMAPGDRRRITFPYENGSSDSESHRAAMKRRYSSISPDPHFNHSISLLYDTADEEVFSEVLEARNNEDSEFECGSDDEDDDDSISISEDVFATKAMQPARKIVEASSSEPPQCRITRNSGCKCSITLAAPGSYSYRISFTRFPHPQTTAPPIERLLGESFQYVSTWNCVDSHLYVFSANEKAKKKYTSSKKLLRDVFQEVIELNNAMYTETMEI